MNTHTCRIWFEFSRFKNSIIIFTFCLSLSLHQAITDKRFQSTFTDELLISWKWLATRACYLEEYHIIAELFCDGCFQNFFIFEINDSIFLSCVPGFLYKLRLPLIMKTYTFIKKLL